MPRAQAPRTRRLVATTALILIGATALARVATLRAAASTQPGIAILHAAPSSDSAAAVAAVTRFQRAIAVGDSASALGLLAADALVLESGDVETRAEYRAHHLPADIEFARAVPSTRTVRAVVVHGDAAWVSSTSKSRGAFRGRAISSAGAELTVLSRSDRDAPWRIRAIHWSSHRTGP